MKLIRIVSSSLALLGAGLIGWGLFAPLVTVPVVGDVRFSENNLGGGSTAWALITMLVLSSTLLASGGLISRVGAVAVALLLGILGGILLSVHRHAMDQVMQIADLGDGKMDEGITKLLAQMEYGSGALSAVVGSLFVLIGIGISTWGIRRQV